MREFRGVAEAAESPVEVALQGGPPRRQRGARERSLHRRRRLHLAEHLDQRVALPAHVVAVLAVILRDAFQQVLERRHAVLGCRREIRAAEERPLVIGREKHGERPATPALRQHLVRRLVDAVEVGTLLAVHLHVHEQLVHEGGRGLVLERLVGHDVAPVAGRITDREQDRLALGACLLESLGSPRIPVHRVAGVLEEVGACLAREAVATRAVGVRMHGGSGPVLG